MTKRIQRQIQMQIETRDSDDGSMVIEGYAAKFNQWADIGGWFQESIARGAFDHADMSDVVLVMNHDNSKLMAGTRNDSLSLEVDDIGLHIRATLIDTQENKDIYKMVKGGLLNKMSFSFTVDEDKWEEKKVGEDEVAYRTITKIGKLYDVSAVTFPAYDTTSLSARDDKSAVEEFRRKIQDERMKEILK